APNRNAWEQRVDIERGPSLKRVRVPVLVGAAVAQATAAVAPDRERHDAPSGAAAGTSGGTTRRTVGLVIAGAGLVGVGVGTVFGMWTFSKEHKSEGGGHCQGTICDATGVELRADARAYATVSTVAFVAGLACVGGGLLLAFTGRSAKSRTST